eukprot:83710_1
MPVSVINNVAYIQCGRKPNNKLLARAMMQRKLIPRTIIIPLKDGPFLLDGIWCFNCTFWHSDTTESRSISFLLSKHLSALHDVLLQHISHWSSIFQQWFTNNSILLPIKYNVGDIVFDYIDQLYIQLTYIANDQYRTCYVANDPYYKHMSALYGGHPVNTQKINDTITLNISRKVLYVSNQSEVVSGDSDDYMQKITKLQNHQTYISTINNLYFHVKQIRSYHLKIGGYGKEKHLKPAYFSKMTFVPVVRMLLETKNYKYKENTNKISFKLNCSQANNIFYKFDWTPFIRYYEEDKVWCYYTKFDYSKRTEVLQVKFFILQQDIDENNSIQGVASIPKN